MLSLRSPAKINLFLRVLNRRSDGYHELASLFQTIDLADHLNVSISSTGSDELTCTDPLIPADPSNLAWKAASLFRHQTNQKFYFKIHIQKQIPQQAGLGGGSSNAATTLWALNQLLNQPATEDQLALWGSLIGSDVPFFLSQGTSYCTGRGEILHPMPPLFKQRLVIVKPPYGMPTPAVYNKLRLSALVDRDPNLALQQFFSGQPSYFNDLEEAAFSVQPALADLKKTLLSSGFETVLLSGSGSSFFCLGCPSTAIAPKIPHCTIFSANYINRTASHWFSL
jgi:4-diphosphocytidyl-2-C-methyl-D-erythritol kinase